MTKLAAPKSNPASAKSAAGRPYRTEIRVRFGDCDPAGIVFYPRYLEIFNALVEDWCRDELQYSFPELITQRGWGLPTVHLEVDFLAPSRFGDILSATLRVEKVGKSSVNININLCSPDGGERVRGKVVLVLIDRKPHKAIPIPDDLRARMLAFRAGE
jgi:4-hydroxybenzoyl-CoA thioesterase